jgi:hypothetical protein
VERSGRHVALALVTAVALGLVTFAARDLVLAVLDRGLARVTLLRVVIALAAVALLQALGSLWRPGALRLPARPLSARGASIALGALTGLAAGTWSALAARVTVPTVFADELIFISLAKSLARGDGALVRGTETFGYGIAYPAVLAPIYALADDGVQAFHAVQVTNAALMASAAVPAYLLARTALPRGDALVVAAFTVATPLLALAAHVMTEALFYPAFLWTTYAVVRALARPTAALQVVALLALAGLCAVRPQAVALLPAAASAALLVGLRSGSLRRQGILLGGLTAVGLAAVAARALLDTSPVGAYDVLVTWPDPLELAVWSGRELAGLGLAVGVVALVVFPIATVRLLGASASDEERSLGATLLAFVPWLVLSVAVLDSSPYGLGWTHLRNLVAAIPLVVLAGVVWARSGMPRPARTATLGAALALLCALALRTADLEHDGRLDAPAFLPWRPFASQVLPLDRLVLLCVTLAVVVALTTRARWALVLSVGAAFLVVAPEIVPAREPPWGVERGLVERFAVLDRAVEGEERTVVIAAGLPDERCDTHPLALLAVWTEVLNASATARHLYGDDLVGPSPLLAIARDGTLLDAGRPLRARAVAIDARVAIEGLPLGALELGELGGELAGSPGGLRFWLVEGAVRLTDAAGVRRLAARSGCPVTRG